MATGTTTLDFGASPVNTATVLVSAGLSGLTIGSHKEAFIQGDDSTGDNDTNSHQMLAYSGRLFCQFVSAASMNITCDLFAGLATGQFTIHWVTA